MKIDEALLQEFGRFVEERIGMCMQQERRSSLSHGMVALARELHSTDIVSCMRRLMASPSTQEQVEMLARHFAVGETYFFRELAVFDTLEYEVLPSLLAARRNCGKRLRIWSAGCCTGEEAYSLAILLSRMIPDIAEWNITLLATDINPAFLGKARHGVYRDWSFRNLPAWIKQRYFEALEPGSYGVLPEIKRLVRFAYLNLADDRYPSVESNTCVMDIVLCRNVMMYFEPARARQVIERLHRSLVNGGWLIVSPAETGSHLFPEFAHVRFPDAVFYRKERDQTAVAAHSHLVDRRPEAIGLRPNSPIVVNPHVTPCTTAENPLALAQLARAHANRGDLDEARRCCEIAIAADKSNPELRYLRAMILEELDQPDAAMHSLRQALYLDHNFVLAHFALGSLYRRHGKTTEATRHFSNAVALLGEYAPDEMLPESGGITAARLSEIIRATDGAHDGA